MFHNNSISHMLTAPDSLLTGEFFGGDIIDNEFTFSSPPPGSYRNIFTSSPIKSPGNGTVLLSELAEEQGGNCRKKSYCSYVYPYDNRRCTNLVDPAYKLEENFCSRHQHQRAVGLDVNGDVICSTPTNNQLRTTNKYQQDDMRRYLKDECSSNAEKNLNEHQFLGSSFSASFFHTSSSLNRNNPAAGGGRCVDKHLARFNNELMMEPSSRGDTVRSSSSPSHNDVIALDDVVIWDARLQEEADNDSHKMNGDDDDDDSGEDDDMLCATLDKEFENNQLNEAEIVKDLKQAVVDVMETQGTDQLELKDFTTISSPNLVINKDSIMNTQHKDDVIMQLETALSAGRQQRKKSELQQQQQRCRPSPIPRTPPIDLPLLESFLNGPDAIKRLTLQLTTHFNSLKKVVDREEEDEELRCVCPPPMKSKIQTTLPSSKNRKVASGQWKNVPCPNCPAAVPAASIDAEDENHVLKSLDDRDYWIPPSIDDDDDGKIEMNLKALSKIRKMCKRQLRKETNRLKALTNACTSHPSECAQLLMSPLCSTTPQSKKGARVQITVCDEVGCTDTPLPYNPFCKEHVYNTEQHLYMNEATTTTTKTKQTNKQLAGKKRKAKSKTAQAAKVKKKQQQVNVYNYKINPTTTTNNNKTVLIDHTTDHHNNTHRTQAVGNLMTDEQFDNGGSSGSCQLQSFSTDPQVGSAYWTDYDNKFALIKNNDNWLCDGGVDHKIIDNSHFDDLDVNGDDNGFGLGLFPPIITTTTHSSSSPLSHKSALTVLPSPNLNNLFESADDVNMNHRRHQLTEDDGGSHELLDTFDDCHLDDGFSNQLPFPPLINIPEEGGGANLCCPPPRPAHHHQSVTQITNQRPPPPNPKTNSVMMMTTTTSQQPRSPPIITVMTSPPAPKRSKPSLVTSSATSSSGGLLGHATAAPPRGRGRGRKVGGGVGRKPGGGKTTTTTTKLQQIQQHVANAAGCGVGVTPAVVRTLVRNGGGKRARGGAKASRGTSRLMMNNNNSSKNLTTTTAVMNKKQQHVGATANKIGATIISPVQQLRLVQTNNSNHLLTAANPSKENSSLVYLIPVSQFVPQRNNGNGGNKTTTSTSTQQQQNYNFLFNNPQQQQAQGAASRQQINVKSIHLNHHHHNNNNRPHHIQRGNSGQLIVINPNQRGVANPQRQQQTYVVQQQKRKAADHQPQTTTTLIRMRPQQHSSTQPIQLQLHHKSQQHQLITSRITPQQTTKVTSVKLCNGGIIQQQTDTTTTTQQQRNHNHTSGQQSVLVGQVGSLSNILTTGGTIRPAQTTTQPKNCRIITCCTSSSPMTSASMSNRKFQQSNNRSSAAMTSSVSSAFMQHMNQSMMTSSAPTHHRIVMVNGSSVATSNGGGSRPLIRASTTGGLMTSSKSSPPVVLHHHKKKIMTSSTT